jgi:hypothetical protein
VYYGGVGGVDSMFYEAPRAGYTTWPSNAQGGDAGTLSDGKTPFLINVPFSAQPTPSQACLKTGGSRGNRKGSRKNRKNRKQPPIANFDDAADAHAVMRENPAEAFAALGSDLYDMSAIWNEACQAFGKQTAEYAAKANTEFRIANAVTPAETSSAAESPSASVKLAA